MTIKLNYKDQEIPVSVGYYALKRYKQETGKEFTTIEGEDITDLEILFWHSIEAGYKQEEQSNPFKREDAEMILDAVMMQFIERIPDFFPTSPSASQERGQTRGTNAQPPKPKRK